MPVQHPPRGTRCCSPSQLTSHLTSPWAFVSPRSTPRKNRLLFSKPFFQKLLWEQRWDGHSSQGLLPHHPAQQQLGNFSRALMESSFGNIFELLKSRYRARTLRGKEITGHLPNPLVVGTKSFLSSTETLSWFC